jgi:hypothetical protein
MYECLNNNKQYSMVYGNDLLQGITPTEKINET